MSDLTSPLGGDDLAKALRDAYGRGYAHGCDCFSDAKRSCDARRDAWIRQYMARLPAAEPIAAGSEARVEAVAAVEYVDMDARAGEPQDDPDAGLTHWQIAEEIGALARDGRGITATAYAAIERAWLRGFEAGGRGAPSREAEAGGDLLRHAFRFADAQDWRFLFECLPDTGEGHFWTAVLRDVLSELNTPGKLVASTGSEEKTKGEPASSIQIREGAYYASAAGERIGPMFRIKGDAAQVWYAKGQRGDWAPDGQALHSFPRDNLVAEWPATEEAAR